VSGWAADRYGARRVFAGAVAVFTVASALCAAATSLAELVAMRVLQGLGGALVVPVGRLVVLRGTPRSDLLRAIAYLTWPGLVAPVIAPALGGLFTTYGSWRWIFVVDVPLGVVALVAALRMVPDLRLRAARPMSHDRRLSIRRPHACSSARWRRRRRGPTPGGRSSSTAARAVRAQVPCDVGRAGVGPAQGRGQRGTRGVEREQGVQGGAERQAAHCASPCVHASAVSRTVSITAASTASGSCTAAPSGVLSRGVARWTVDTGR
jgi:hypothetical protein